MRVTTTYQKHTIQRKATYHCNCGNKFYRVNSDWFTINPYNTKTPSELVKELSIKLDEKPRNCPKCGEECQPKIKENGKKIRDTEAISEVERS